MCLFFCHYLSLDIENSLRHLFPTNFCWFQARIEPFISQSAFECSTTVLQPLAIPCTKSLSFFVCLLVLKPSYVTMNVSETIFYMKTNLVNLIRTSWNFYIWTTHNLEGLNFWSRRSGWLHQPQYWFRKEEPDNVDDMFSPGDEMASKDNIANEDGTLNCCKGS